MDSTKQALIEGLAAEKLADICIGRLIAGYSAMDIEIPPEIKEKITLPQLAEAHRAFKEGFSKSLEELQHAKLTDLLSQGLSPNQLKVTCEIIWSDVGERTKEIILRAILQADDDFDSALFALQRAAYLPELREEFALVAQGLAKSDSEKDAVRTCVGAWKDRMGEGC